MTKPLKTANETATERFNLIAQLVDDSLDKGRRRDLMHEVAQRACISVRTLKRYLEAYEAHGFEGLKPKQGWERPDSSLGLEFAEVVDAAIELRRESPSRSVADIIRILEMEEAVEPGTVARSTLQRHLAEKGFASSQMHLYINKGAAARRFQKEHRNQLWMSDIKVGPYVTTLSGKKKQIFLVVWIDDATRFVVSARFYTDQTVNAIEDSLRRAIQSFGAPDKIFVDNGQQYRSKWLSETCAKLKIRLLTAKPYRPESKGVVERFNRTIDKFLSEAAVAKLPGIEAYNDFLRVWLEEYYHKNIHSALAGVSPSTAFGTDTRSLRFVHADILRDAFLHTDKRRVDKTGCISFNGSKFEVGIAYIGRKIEIRFDPSWTEEVEVIPAQSAPFHAKKLQIGPNCGTSQELPEHMRTVSPDSSRMLDGLKKKSGKNKKPPAIATTYAALWEGDKKDV